MKFILERAICSYFFQLSGSTVYCKQLCDVYHEVFNEEQGCFRGASAIMQLKPGGLEAITKSGPRPVSYTHLTLPTKA